MLASTLPKTRINAIEITVNRKVLPSDLQNTGSRKMSAKFCKPTQSNDGSPAVTSEKLNAMASTNGIATSATM